MDDASEKLSFKECGKIAKDLNLTLEHIIFCYNYLQVFIFFFKCCAMKRWYFTISTWTWASHFIPNMWTDNEFWRSIGNKSISTGNKKKEALFYLFLPFQELLQWSSDRYIGVYFTDRFRDLFCLETWNIYIFISMILVSLPLFFSKFFKFCAAWYGHLNSLFLILVLLFFLI